MRITKTSFWILKIFIISILVLGCSRENAIEKINDTVENTDGTGNQPTGQNGEITLYRVNGETIEKVRDYNVSGQDLVYQKDVAKHQEIWGLVKKIVPLSHRSKMTEFMIYNGETSGSAGYVFEVKRDLSAWQMGIAINFSNNRRELVYTIIHEFGHILTLNDTQLNASISQSTCSNYYPGEGCSNSNSYINKSYQRYWSDIWSEFQQIGNNQSAHQQFYERYQNRFVTNYAATNPGEDIAEVFATFVTQRNKPSGSTIAEKKILLMYEHSELVELRNYIRGNSVTNRLKGTESDFLPEPGSWKQAKTIGNINHSHCKVRH